ncbi:hypothetical protein BaRGS_00022741 [Batillaria attramentaria]|uniref:Secreted protein n=2 Tax=Batillaria attramentaria TaxID=370345 RepID=A0ABD0KFN4_9CAEN
MRILVVCLFFVSLVSLAGLLLLLSGDVELNPGPGEEQHGAATATTECTVTDTDTDTAGKDFTIGDVMKVLLGVQKDVADIKQDGTVVRQRLAELEEENKTLKQQNARLTKRVEDMTQKVDTLDRHTTRTLDAMDKEIENQEQRARRNNLRFFNIAETGKNSYTACAEQVFELLRSVFPERNWCRNDIERCHRIGKKGQKPRPVIVKFLHWSDKMAILNTGRQRLWQHGVSVAGA